jgi:hypothetical protein
LGFDYSDFSDMPSDVRRWVKVLRVSMLLLLLLVVS